MNDLISRQALMDVIDETDWYRVNKNGELVLGASTEGEALYRASDIYEVIGTLPYDGVWIPTSMLMPNVDEEVFVYLFKDCACIAWWDGKRWQTEDFEVDEDEEPTVWMPLPPPLERRIEMTEWKPKDGCEKVRVLTDYKLGKELTKEQLMWIARFYEQAYRDERDKA